MISLFVIPIILVYYRYGVKWTYLTALFSVAIAVASGIIRDSSVFNIGVKSFLFIGFALLIHLFSEMFDEYKRKYEIEYERINAKNKKINKQDKQIKKVNKELELKMSKMFRLYDIVKQMSGALKFEDIFNVFTNTMKEMFEFTKCSLVVLDDKNNIDKIYTIGSESSIVHIDKVGNINAFSTVTEPVEKMMQLRLYKHLIAQLEKYKMPIAIDSTKDNVDEDKLFLLMENVKSFIVVPLVIENRMTGILCVDNLKEENFENFLILAGSFALEMKKVDLYERVEQFAFTDGLTGAYVRRHFLERFIEEIDRSLRHYLHLSLLMLDIDRFKTYNDKYGHLVGDVLLKKIVDIIKINVREIDLVCRYGGEEFCVLLQDTDRESGEQVAERIRLAVEEYSFNAYGQSLSATVSMGVSVFPEDAKNPKQLIEKADAALYHAKATGRNKVCFWNGKIQKMKN